MSDTIKIKALIKQLRSIAEASYANRTRIDLIEVGMFNSLLNETLPGDTHEEILVNLTALVDAINFDIAKYSNDQATIDELVSLHMDRFAIDVLSINDKASKHLTKSLRDDFSVSDWIIVPGNVVTMDSGLFDDFIQYTIAKQLSDTPAITDAISFIIDRSSLIETPSISDTPSLSVNLVLQELITVTDIFNSDGGTGLTDNSSVIDDTYISYDKALLESTNLPETIAKTLVRNISDSVGVTDLFSSTSAIGATLDGNTSVNDISKFEIDSNKQELAQISDVFTKVFTALRQWTENTTISELFNLEFSKITNESVLLSDISNIVIVKNLFDTANISGAFNYSGIGGSFNSLLEGNPTVSEVLNKNIATTKADSFLLTDTSYYSLDKNFTETVTISEAIAYGLIGNYSKVFSGNPAINEILSLELNKAFLDNNSITDYISQEFTKILTDSLVISDVLVSNSDYESVISGNAGVTDTYSQLLNKHLFDSILISDVFIKDAGHTETITGNTSITDILSKDFYLNVADNVTITDLFNKQSVIADNFAGTTTFTDAYQFILNKGTLDNAVITDSFAYVLGVNILANWTMDSIDGTTVFDEEASYPLSRSNVTFDTGTTNNAVVFSGAIDSYLESVNVTFQQNDLSVEFDVKLTEHPIGATNIGTSGPITVTSDAQFSIDTAGQLSIVGLFKSGDVVTKQGLISKSSVSAQEWGIVISGSKLYAVIFDGSNSIIRKEESSTISPDTIYQFVVNFTGYTNTDEIEIYINDVKDNTLVSSNALTYSAGSTNIHLGTIYEGGVAYDYSGVLDDTAVMPRTLTTTEIADLYTRAT